MKRLFFTGGALIILDQILKNTFENTRALVTSNFGIKYAENTGAAFGTLKDSTPILTTVSIVAIIIILYYYLKLSQRKNFSKSLSLGMILLFAGTIGNLIDRIFFGYVRDFILIWKWPVFNLADTFSCIGVALIIIYVVKTDYPKVIKKIKHIKRFI
ncbi:MAG: signal peptidase II [archaeon]